MNDTCRIHASTFDLRARDATLHRAVVERDLVPNAVGIQLDVIRCPIPVEEEQRVLFQVRGAHGRGAEAVVFVLQDVGVVWPHFADDCVGLPVFEHLLTFPERRRLDWPEARGGEAEQCRTRTLEDDPIGLRRVARGLAVGKHDGLVAIEDDLGEGLEDLQVFLPGQRGRQQRLCRRAVRHEHHLAQRLATTRIPHGAHAAVNQHLLTLLETVLPLDLPGPQRAGGGAVVVERDLASLDSTTGIVHRAGSAAHRHTLASTEATLSRQHVGRDGRRGGPVAGELDLAEHGAAAGALHDGLAAAREDRLVGLEAVLPNDGRGLEGLRERPVVLVGHETISDAAALVLDGGFSAIDHDALPDLEAAAPDEARGCQGLGRGTVLEERHLALVDPAAGVVDDGPLAVHEHVLPTVEAVLPDQRGGAEQERRAVVPEDHQTTGVATAVVLDETGALIMQDRVASLEAAQPREVGCADLCGGCATLKCDLASGVATAELRDHATLAIHDDAFTSRKASLVPEPLQKVWRRLLHVVRTYRGRGGRPIFLDADPVCVVHHHRLDHGLVALHDDALALAERGRRDHLQFVRRQAVRHDVGGLEDDVVGLVVGAIRGGAAAQDDGVVTIEHDLHADTERASRAP
mmetsp:Transcript_86680/g.280042  ORF Transcript_86680/g.280042 Transcript_86680/m.280042 type:complete len:633 (+) Transcript_86680:2548-4446(+)